jgi:hypothetical protein
MTTLTIEAGSVPVLQAVVRDAVTTAPLDSAVVTVIVTDSTGAQVTGGPTWPLTLPYLAGSAGVYRASLPLTTNFSVGQGYYAAFTILASGQTTQFTSQIVIVPAGSIGLPAIGIRSLLFIKQYAVAEMRNERLVMMAKTYFPGVTLSDDYIWNKLRAAENETGRDLRVPLVPTQFYSIDPTPDQLAALPPGMPWAIDPAQDYDPDFFQGERWGFLVLRNKPVISVQQVQFVYPSPTTGFFDFPLDWIRIDKKYAQIRFVPASSTFVAPLNAFLLQALGGGRTIPFAFNVTYQAGINAEADYPQLIDLIKRRAALKIVEDGFLPSSGSISADGLSQSLSINLDSYRDMIDVTLNGPKGSNGGLMTAIHGIRMASLGN